MTNTLTIQHHMNSILESRLILDEDIDVILLGLHSFKLRDTEESDKKHKRNTIICFASCFTGVALSCIYNETVYVIISTLPLVINLGLQLEHKLMEYHYKKSIEELILNFSKMHSLNRNIRSYIKTRNIVSLSCDSSTFNCITGDCRIFLDCFSVEIIGILKLLKASIKNMLLEKISEIVDYSYLEQCDLDNFTISLSTDSLECLNFLQKIIDLSVLLISNFLSCLALTISTKQHQLDFVFNKYVFPLQKALKSFIKSITNKFDKLRFSIDLKNVYCENKVRKIPMKNNHPLSNLLTHMQITFEMAQNIYRELQQDDATAKDIISSEKLLELKNELNNCQVILESFIRAYSITIKRALNNEVDNKKLMINEKNVKAESLSTLVRWDDFPDEPQEDEEYDLYVDEDNESIEPPCSYDEETNCSAYLPLILQELQHNLKERQAIVASRKKKYKVVGRMRNKIDEENKQSPETTEQTSLHNSFIKESEQSEYLTSSPPYPPQLPTFLNSEVAKVEEMKSMMPCPNNFMNTIKVIAKQRCQQEDTFGDDCDTDSDAD